MATYKTLEECIELIDSPAREGIQRLYADHETRLRTSPGSSHNHQAWPGGWYDHVTETMNIAMLFYPALNEARPLQFSVSDALVSLFLHDIEKPWKYLPGDENIQTKDDRQRFREKIINQYVALTPEQSNAVEFAEGELHQYSSKQRHMLPLAAFVHMCDVWSARGWHDRPYENDSWGMRVKQL
jgi:hypothetical protein